MESPLYVLIFFALMSNGTAYTPQETMVYKSEQMCEQALEKHMPEIAKVGGVVTVHAACVKVVTGKGVDA